MKKILSSIAISVIAVTSIYAGDGYAPAEVEPVAVPTPSTDSFYIGGGLVANSFKADCSLGKCHKRITDITYGGVVKAGYNLNKYLGFEGRLAVAFLEKDFMKAAYAGVYIKPQYPINNYFNLYGLVGYGYTHFSFGSKNIKSATTNVTAPSIGVGVEYFVDGTAKTDKSGLSVWTDVTNTMNNKKSKRYTNYIFSAGASLHF